jgi:hypothetical protein
MSIFFIRLNWSVEGTSSFSSHLKPWKGNEKFLHNSFLFNFNLFKSCKFVIVLIVSALVVIFNYNLYVCFGFILSTSLCWYYEYHLWIVLMHLNFLLLIVLVYELYRVCVLNKTECNMCSIFKPYMVHFKNWLE